MNNLPIIPHLFRTESRKIMAVLSRYFGMGHLDVVEDIASETFLMALETWPYQGVPENPEAWLYAVAKNKALNYLRRNQVFSDKITPVIQQTGQVEQPPEIDLSDKNIQDSQLQMLFAICHPCLSTQEQICISLRMLCGFGIEEIATALLSNKETINKRLFRAKEKLRSAKVSLEFPPPQAVAERLDTVLTTLYLQFNEGYYSECKDSILREAFCVEAMRQTLMLTAMEQTRLPKVYALLALMCFHSSRFAARKNDHGEIILYQDQDETRWNQELISKGAYYLHQATGGDKLSKYHLEASIAYWNTIKTDTTEKWENILHLYNHLLQMEYSPIAALNRTFALSKVRGNAAAITAAEKLQLDTNPYYFTLLGVLYSEQNPHKALENFTKAKSIAKTTADKRYIQQKIEQLINL